MTTAAEPTSPVPHTLSTCSHHSSPSSSWPNKCRAAVIPNLYLSHLPLIKIKLNHGNITGSKLIVILFPFACEVMKWSVSPKALTAEAKRGIPCIYNLGGSPGPRYLQMAIHHVAMSTPLPYNYAQLIVICPKLLCHYQLCIQMSILKTSLAIWRKYYRHIRENLKREFSVIVNNSNNETYF